MWKKNPWSDKTTISIFGLYAKCYAWQTSKTKPLLENATPDLEVMVSKKVVEASLCGNIFLLPGQENWSELMGIWME